MSTDLEPVNSEREDQDLERVDMEGVRITSRQALFIERFLDFMHEENGAAKAVVAAGYRTQVPDQKAEQLLTNAFISKVIFARVARMQRTNDLNRDRIISGFLKEAEEDGEGAQHSARVSAWAHLARIHGLFEKGAAEDRKVVAINFDPDLEDEEDTEYGDGE
jgi:hypothetical protein